ncbi:MAG: tRNA (adenosine(37)-N6)-threonylcarbamoyltransferase complex dimerization subunit type 1 TsaB [Ferruginibacter sp.]
MSIILNIDSCTEIAHVSLAQEGSIIASVNNHDQKNHSAFLHTAIAGLLNSTGTDKNELAAVAVTAGPGSYTGIRIGMASAKGLCFALNKPLILINSLEMLARDAIMHFNFSGTDKALICPMIDARRMEVFTALYDLNGQNILPPQALILSPDSFKEYKNDRIIFYVGGGSVKWKLINTNSNNYFLKDVNVATAMAYLSNEMVLLKAFADVCYSEAIYVKAFYDG